MFLGYIKLVIFIPHSKSLKDKRQVIESLRNKLQNNFNVAVAEKPSDKWQSAELSLACINYNKAKVNSLIERIEDFVRFNGDFSIIEIEKQII